MSRVIRSLSFDTVKDADVLQHLDKKENKTLYIKSLIEADMKNKSTFSKDQKTELKKLFMQMLEEYLKNNEICVDKKSIENFDQDAIDALEQFD